MPDRDDDAANAARHTLAKNLRRRRAAAGLSTRELDRLAGTPRGTTHYAEREKRHISVAHVARLAAALGCTPAHLLTERFLRSIGGAT